MTVEKTLNIIVSKRTYDTKCYVQRDPKYVLKNTYLVIGEDEKYTKMFVIIIYGCWDYGQLSFSFFLQFYICTMTMCYFLQSEEILFCKRRAILYWLYLPHLNVRQQYFQCFLGLQ